MTATTDTRNACELLIEAIGPIAVQHGTKKLILHGDHKDDLNEVDMLLAVEDMDSFYERAYPAIAGEAFMFRMCGSIIARPEHEFPNGFIDMAAWYADNETVRSYEKDGDRLVAVQ